MRIPVELRGMYQGDSLNYFRIVEIPDKDVELLRGIQSRDHDEFDSRIHLVWEYGQNEVQLAPYTRSLVNGDIISYLGLRNSRNGIS